MILEIKLLIGVQSNLAISSKVVLHHQFQSILSIRSFKSHTIYKSTNWSLYYREALLLSIARLIRLFWTLLSEAVSKPIIWLQLKTLTKSITEKEKIIPDWIWIIPFYLKEPILKNIWSTSSVFSGVRASRVSPLTEVNWESLLQSNKRISCLEIYFWQILDKCYLPILKTSKKSVKLVSFRIVKLGLMQSIFNQITNHTVLLGL